MCPELGCTSSKASCALVIFVSGFPKKPKRITKQSRFPYFLSLFCKNKSPGAEVRHGSLKNQCAKVEGLKCGEWFGLAFNAAAEIHSKIIVLLSFLFT